MVTARHHVLPGLAPDVARFKGSFHLFGALVENASGSHDVVADFGVPHVGIAREADRDTVGANGN